MAQSLAQINKEIAKLTEQAAQMRRKEVQTVVARIREAIDTYDLTAADLGLSGAGKRRRQSSSAKKASGKGAAGAVKYRDKDGNTWGGRGPRPLWLREALAGGADLSDYAV